MELYVHIPFCAAKCKYCAFVSFPNKSDRFFDYLTALNREISLAGQAYPDRNITSIYFGGGTPSVLPDDAIPELLKSIKSRFKVDPDAEITVECNPESTTENKLRSYKSAGVNRVSFGVQSLFDDNLKAVGRIHDRKTAIDALAAANRVFDNVSADFIVGLPYDSNERVKEEIAVVAPYVKHCSVYMLTLEEGTALFDEVKSGKISVPDEDGQIELFHAAASALSECGIDRYEVSNFARQGFKSRHNDGYWTREEYLGLGLNASSLVKDYGEARGEFRFKHVEGLEKYIRTAQTAEKFPFAYVSEGLLTREEIEEERVMLGFRLVEGVETSTLGDKARLLREKFGEYVVEREGRIALNSRGFDVMDAIIGEIF